MTLGTTAVSIAQKRQYPFRLLICNPRERLKSEFITQAAARTRNTDNANVNIAAT